jgi:hypothetical protein
MKVISLPKLITFEIMPLSSVGNIMSILWKIRDEKLYRPNPNANIYLPTNFYSSVFDSNKLPLSTTNALLFAYRF